MVFIKRKKVMRRKKKSSDAGFPSKRHSSSVRQGDAGVPSTYLPPAPKTSPSSRPSDAASPSKDLPPGSTSSSRRSDTVFSTNPGSSRRSYTGLLSRESGAGSPPRTNTARDSTTGDELFVPKERKKRKSYAAKRKAEQEQLLELVQSHLDQPNREDGNDAFGKVVAAKMKRLEPKQCFIAEKIINDVLYEAMLEQLTTSSYVCIPRRPTPVLIADDRKASVDDRKASVDKRADDGKTPVVKKADDTKAYVGLSSLLF